MSENTTALSLVLETLSDSYPLGATLGIHSRTSHMMIHFAWRDYGNNVTFYYTIIPEDNDQNATTCATFSFSAISRRLHNSADRVLQVTSPCHTPTEACATVSKARRLEQSYSWSGPVIPCSSC